MKIRKGRVERRDERIRKEKVKGKIEVKEMRKKTK
jgi:hypothetical protein